MRLLTLFSVVLLALMAGGSALAQGDQGREQMVVGQTAQGRPVMLMILPLKYMDPAVAAQLFGGTVTGGQGYGGAIARSDEGFRGGYGGGTASRPRTTSQRSGRFSQQGYDGYQGGLQRYNEFPGYQSPYNYR
jgi:hypothetical protein